MFKKFLHELNYLKAEDFLQIFVFLIAIIPSLFYTLYVKLAKKEIWLICEDKNEARDNGFCFFKFLNENKPDIVSYYAINPKSGDYAKVKATGKTVTYGSIFHWMLYFACRFNISSQKAGKPNVAVGYVLERLGILKSKFIFLQHGITLSRAEWLFYENTRMRLFICGAKPEYDYVKELFGYPEDNVKYLGFTRFDDYFTVKPNTKQIVLMPSWREWIGSKNEFSTVYEDTSDFTNTEYYQKYQSLINNSRLTAFLEKNDLTLYFYPHRNMQKFIDNFSTSSNNIKIVDNKNSDIRKLLTESAVMITDYSSVALDFAYMKKPVIYYQFDEKRFREAQYAEGYFSYRNAGLGKVFTEEADVVEYLEEIYSNDCAVSQEFLSAHEEFFPLWDDQNCERTYACLKGM